MKIFKNIFFSEYAFLGIVFFMINGAAFILFEYLLLTTQKICVNDLKNYLDNILNIIIIVVFIYFIIFIFKYKQYVLRLSSYSKPFEFSSIIVGIIFTLTTILIKYQLVDSSKYGLELEIQYNLIFLNLYFNLIVVGSALILLFLFFSLLLDFDIKTYMNKNRLFKEYILTEFGWIEGSNKLCIDRNEIKVTEPNDFFLIVKAYINEKSDNQISFDTKSLIDDYDIEEVELVKKHFNNREISKYYIKHYNCAFENKSIKNIEILDKFKQP